MIVYKTKDIKPYIAYQNNHYRSFFSSQLSTNNITRSPLNCFSKICQYARKKCMQYSSIFTHISIIYQKCSRKHLYSINTNNNLNFNQQMPRKINSRSMIRID